MDTHLLPCTLVLILSLPTKLCDQHQGHHLDHLLRLQIAPKLLIFLHPPQGMRPQELLVLQDHLVRYSFFVSRCNYQHLYRLQMRYLGLTLYLKLPLSLADPVQLIDVVMPRWQLPPKLFCHELRLVLNRQGIFQCQFQLELKGDGDQIRHLLPPRPSQSGHLLVIHRSQQQQHREHFLPFLNTHSLGQII